MKKVPGSNPGWGNGTLSKITKILFLIEDTSELECWTLVKYPKRHSNMSPGESLMSPGESLPARRKVRISWLSSGLRDFPQGSWWLSLGVTKDELECLQGIWDRSCIPRSPQNNSSPPYRKLENGRNLLELTNRQTIENINWNLHTNRLTIRLLLFT